MADSSSEPDPPDEPGNDPFASLLERAARLTPLPRNAAPRLHPGLELLQGRFQVQRRIGAGGMGVVHEAYDRERACMVALKTLAHLDAVGIYRLKQEFRALSEVMHPNLVQLHELFADGDLWLFTMELISGEPFDRWVRPAGTLDEARLRSALRQLVEGVRAIHAAGKLHRDLKPSNVLVTREGRVVVLDFGLVADPEVGGNGQTLDGERRSGTPAYMAPEQAAGEATTAASDWYAVGVMAFEALTGRLPFDGRSAAIMERKQTDAVPRVRGVSPTAPADLDDLCAALLARDPRERPSTEAIVAALASASDAAGSMPMLAPSTRSMPPRPTELVGRHDELAALRDAYTAAQSGKAVVVRIRGESGVGKSALAATFLDELRADGRTVVLAGRCYERESVPYKAFDRVVDELTRYLRQLRDVEVAALMPRDTDALARVFPVLRRVELIADCPARPAPNDQELRRRAFEAFAELLARIRDRRMLVVHIDDLQWIDHDSMLLLEHLLVRADPSPILLIAGCGPLRPVEPLFDRIERTARRDGFQLRDVVLGPLSHEATAALTRALLGDAATENVVQVVATEAEGMPLFAGELARYALETRAGTDVDRVSLEQAISNRIARLGHDAQRVIELLTLCGRPIAGKALAQVLGSAGDAYRALDLLRNAQLVRETSSGYECYHDRIRIVVAERMEAAAARDGHLQLIAALSAQPGIDAQVLFEHTLAAGERESAGAHAVAAATAAAASLAFDRCASFLEHAIALLPEAEIERLGLRERRAEALSLGGRWTDAARAFEQAELHCKDEPQRLHLLRQSALHWLGSGHGIEGLPQLRRVYAAEGIRWPMTRAGALLGALARLLWLWLRGAPRRSPQAQRDLARSESDAIVLERLLEAAGLVPAYDFARGLHFMSTFVVRALRCGEPSHLALALAMLAAMFSGMRPMRRLGGRLADEACAIARTQDAAHLRSATLCFAGSARLTEGRLPEALALAAEAESLLRPSGRAHVYGTWTARALQSQVLIELGYVGRAAALYEANARLAREVGDAMAMIGGDSAWRYLVVDDIEGARALIERKQRALAGTEPTGMLHELVHVETLMCALYDGRGAELIWDSSLPGFAAPKFFDASVLIACCALQGPSDRMREKERIVRKVTRGLRSEARFDHRTGGMLAQLNAALAFAHGDVQGAIALLAVAGEHYARAEFALHAAIMRWHAGRLRGGVDGEQATAQAEQFMRDQEIVRPEAWARMLAPGFDAIEAPPRSAGAVPL